MAENVLLQCLFLLALTSVGKSLTFPPMIIEQPPKGQIPFNPGESITLVCRATGSPDPEYYWHYNDEKFDASGANRRIATLPGSGTLVFSDPIKKDEGYYQCFAKNKFGVSTSIRAYLKVAEIGQFPEKGTKEHRPRVGDYLSLPCTPPKSFPTPEIIWSLKEPRGGFTPVRLNDRVTIDHEGNLCFTNVIKEDYQDGKTYACVVENKVTRKVQDGSYQKILPQGETPQNSAPVLMKHTAFVTTVAAGSNFSAKCVFSGRPTPRVDWTSTFKSFSSRVQKNSFGMELVIKNIQPEDAGSYECEGINDESGVPESRVFKVKVLSPPKWVSKWKPESVDAGIGDTVMFFCKSSGNPLTSNQWFINGVKVSTLEKDDNRIVEPNRMIFRDLKKDGAKVIQCNSTNAQGYVFANAYLNVLSESPKIIVHPGTKIAAEGQDVTLRCEVKGSPKPLVVWRKGSEQLTGGRYQVMGNGDLKISQLTLVDAGVYFCNASNKFGGNGTSGTLIVRRKTKIQTKPLDFMVIRDSEAKFICTATTDPEEIENLQIRWKKDGQFIDYTKAHRIFQNYMDNSLTISGTIDLDTGEYTCFASNGRDSDEASAQLIVQDIPDEPTDIRVECRKEQRKALVYWSPGKDNYAPILNYLVQYNTSFSPDSWYTAKESENATASVRRIDITMSPWGNYTFRVRARNKVGMSPPSLHSKVMCTTEPAAPDKSPDNVYAEGDRPDNMIIYWTPMPKIEQNGPNFYYMIDYFLNGTDDHHYHRVDNPLQDRLEITDSIRTYTEFIVEVRAHNSDGGGPVKQVVGHSGEDAPLEVPQNVKVVSYEIKSTSVVLTWDAVNMSPEFVRGFFKGYRIEFWKTAEGIESRRETDWIINDPRRYGLTRVKRDVESGRVKRQADPATDTTTTTEAPPVPVQTGDPTTVRYTLRDLPPYSDITVRVLVLNKGYAGQPSLEVRFKTPEGLPAPPADLKVVVRGPNYFDLEWERPSNENGILTGYNISYQEIDGLNLGRLQYRDPVTDPNALEAKLPGLMSEQNYRVYLAASTRSGRGEPIFIDVETTTPTKPNAPTFIVSDIGETWAMIVWEPSRYGNPGSVFYVQHRGKDEYHWFHSPDVTRIYQWNITTLNPGITYEVRVISKNGIDQETPSDKQDFRTKGMSAAEVNVGAMPWFIGLIVILFFMVLLVVAFIFIKKKRDIQWENKERERDQLAQQEQSDRAAYGNDYARSVTEDYEFESSKSHYSSSMSDVKHPPSESVEYSDESYEDHPEGAVGYSADPRGPPGSALPPVHYRGNGHADPDSVFLEDRKPKSDQNAMDTFV